MRAPLPRSRMPKVSPTANNRQGGILRTGVAPTGRAAEHLVVDYHLLAAALRLSVTATIADLDPAGVSFSRSLTDDLNRTAEIIEAFEEELE